MAHHLPMARVLLSMFRVLLNKAACYPGLQVPRGILVERLFKLNHFLLRFEVGKFPHPVLHVPLIHMDLSQVHT